MEFTEEELGGPQHCERCGERLILARIVWLELNSHTGIYSRNEGETPAEESQGWFPFGSACAKSVLAAQERPE